jgi:hypothetical protein
MFGARRLTLEMVPFVPCSSRVHFSLQQRVLPPRDPSSDIDDPKTPKILSRPDCSGGGQFLRNALESAHVFFSTPSLVCELSSDDSVLPCGANLISRYLSSPFYTSPKAQCHSWNGRESHQPLHSHAPTPRLARLRQSPKRSAQVSAPPGLQRRDKGPWISQASLHKLPDVGLTVSHPL